MVTQIQSKPNYGPTMPNFNLNTVEGGIGGNFNPAKNLELEAVDITPRPQATKYRDSDPEQEPGSPRTHQNTSGPNFNAAADDLTALALSNPTYEGKKHQQLPHGPLRVLNPKTLTSRAALMEQLLPTLPLNQFDLPNFIYRADLLDYTQFQKTLTRLAKQDEEPDPNKIAYPLSYNPKMDVSDKRSLAYKATLGTPLQQATNELQDALEAATEVLQYGEGFPTLPNGMPFWQQLPYETQNEFAAFIQYLELGGARQLHLLDACSLEDARSYFFTNYWSYRVKAFDLFKAADEQVRRINRMIRTENDHYTLSAALFKKLSDKLSGQEFLDKLDELDATDLVSVLDKVVKIQRLSSGLSVTGTETKLPTPLARPTLQDTMRTITEAQGQSQSAQQEDTMDLINDNPDALDLAQALIIKTTHSRMDNNGTLPQKGNLEQSKSNAGEGN